MPQDQCAIVGRRKTNLLVSQMDSTRGSAPAARNGNGPGRAGQRAAPRWQIRLYESKFVSAISETAPELAATRRRSNPVLGHWCNALARDLWNPPTTIPQSNRQRVLALVLAFVLATFLLHAGS